MAGIGGTLLLGQMLTQGLEFDQCPQAGSVAKRQSQEVLGRDDACYLNPYDAVLLPIGKGGF